MTCRNDHLAHDWFPRPLPENIQLAANVYIETSYIFAAFFSAVQPGLVMEEGSGAYGRTCIATGPGAAIRVGAYTCLNGPSLIADDAIDIGAHCLFAWGTIVTDLTTPRPEDIGRRRRALIDTTNDPSRRLRPMADTKPVHIADNVWVGFDAVITGGVSVGRGAVIGCKAVVTENVPPYAVVVGNPCRIVRYLEPDDSEDVRMAALREFGLV
jgi:acetyltransferase-like isoleucine patch superfamily enzyme